MPDSADYFALFKLERRYRIDPAELDRRFLSLTRNIHPDFFTGKPDEMRGLSVRLTAELNDGYRILKDPVLRAGYLLERAGGAAAAEDRSVPPEVLTQVMLLREEMEEADGDLGALNRIGDQVREHREHTLERIAVLADDLESADEDAKSGLRTLINSVKYYDKLLAELPLA